MDNFWAEHGYILYIGCVSGFAYLVFTAKMAIKTIEKWREKIEEDISVLQERQSLLRETLPVKYVLVEKYDMHIQEIKATLNRIAEKLDCKADKVWDRTDRRTP